MSAHESSDWFEKLQGCAFLAARGFEVAHRTFDMRRRTDEIPDVELPTGFVLRTYRPGPEDDAAWIRLHEDGYGGRYDFTPLTEQDLVAVRDLPDFRLWMLEYDREIVGFCETRVREDQASGLINSVVVESRLHSRGLGQAFLTRAILDLAAQGLETLELSVDADNAAAFRLYRKLGFEVYDEDLNYRRPSGLP